MADLGSVQLLAFAFDADARLPSDVARQVRRLRARGVIGVLDVLIVSKDENGSLRYQAESLGSAVSSFPSDSALRRLFDDDASDLGSVESLELQSVGEIGLDLETIETFACRLQPGTTSLLLLVEATWASALRDAVLAADGFPMMFGCLEPETMLVLGPSLARAAAARANAEVTAAAVSAEMLDALAGGGDAASVAVAATLRTLLAAGLIVEADVVEAVRAIAEADLLPRSALSSATTLRVAGRAPTADT